MPDMREAWVHATGEGAGEVCNSTDISAEVPGTGICVDHDRRVNRVTLAPEAYRGGAYPEGTRRRDMLPADALNECYDQWHSGPSLNCAEVMSHVGRLLGRE